MRRIAHALVLTILMLSSGCLGLLGDDDSESVVKESIPIELSMNGYNEFEFDQPAILSGSCNCEELNATIVASIANGAVQGIVEIEADTFSVNFGILPSGTYSVRVTLTNQVSTSDSEVIFETITILSPPENPVSISAYPPVVYAESGESSIARVKITHAALNTCSGFWEDELERSQAVTISGEYGSVQLQSIESSFNGTFTISCGSSEITTASVDVYVYIFSEENPDLDGDGIPDEFDRCPESQITFNSDSTNDIDGDGCHDTSEDTDDDDDGRPDSSDRCGRGMIGWDSMNTSLDHDGDGCHDASEDTDDDDDTIPDLNDNCPLSVAGWFSTGASDYDRDGCHDLTNDADDDNDGSLDIDDNCPKGVVGWERTNETDFDMDGCRDMDEDGDDDADMVPDVDDWCNRTLMGAVVNEFGCAAYEWDGDGDGIMDDADQCAGTPAGLEVNELGCADLDSDGIFANVDQCPNSNLHPRWTVDSDGCNLLQIPLDWNTGPYSTERFGIVGDFTVQTKSGNWVMSRDWDGESTYLFIFNQDSSSYMSS